ncbi:MAG: efflux RND transporter periplasmic adaptor subunit [Planctomycetes bacterium]|nr:efflux RND transporter periplasmic adaptor subunit [Planctomycetota bacterium]MBM4083399.1 efflux RND transporter periplasmic adaptor subunit [Planctomycetota bacterium]
MAGWQKTISRTLMALAVIAALAAGGHFLFREAPLNVRTVTAKRGHVDQTVTATTAGTVRAKYQVTVCSELPGKVKAILHDEGSRVAEGDVVVLMDTSELESQLRLAEANLAVAESELQQSKTRMKKTLDDFGRAEMLNKTEVASKQEFDAARSERDLAVEAVNTAQSSIQQRKAALEVARINLDKARIKAPFAGIVSRKLIEKGESLVTGWPVFEVVDDSEIHIRAPIDEVDSGKLQLGQRARITSDAFPGKSFWGRLIEISPVVSTQKEQNRTVDVKVAMEGERPVFRVGMSADAEIITNTKPDALFVPSYAIMERDRRKLVYVLASPRVEERRIETGLTNWDRTEIVSGLAEGDHVVVSLDVKGLKNGAVVKCATSDEAEKP